MKPTRARRARRGGRVIGVVTTGRSDYGLMRPVFAALAAERGVRPVWLVTGAHLSWRFGTTLGELRRDPWGGHIEKVRTFGDSDSPAATASIIARTVEGFSRLYTKLRPDLLVVLGDRFETLGVVAASVPFGIPIAHIHGGEITEGAFDEGIRHAITKLSHLHFVSHATYARRVRQLGEEAWRIVVSGAPGLDGIRDQQRADLRDLERAIGAPIGRDALLVTYHPETLHSERTLEELDATLRAIGRVGAPVIMTAPNADPGREVFDARARAFVKAGPRRVFVASLGQARYFALLARVGAMVGNSSSGIIEAPSFGLPVVNIGDRQLGRIRAVNVIDVRGNTIRIERAIRRALSPAFRRRLHARRNPYGDGHAGRRIARVLASVALDGRLIVKRFVDRPAA